MAGAAAAIVTDDVKALETERAHQAQLVRGHRAKRVVRTIGRARRLVRVAGAPQIRSDHRKPLGEQRRDSSPHGERLRKTVQQQDGRTPAAHAVVDTKPADKTALLREALEQGAALRPDRLPQG